jgi:hypothetical protein
MYQFDMNFSTKNHKKYTKNVNDKLIKFVFEYKIIFTVFRKGGKNTRRKNLKEMLNYVI